MTCVVIMDAQCRQFDDDASAASAGLLVFLMLARDVRPKELAVSPHFSLTGPPRMCSRTNRQLHSASKDELMLRTTTATLSVLAVFACTVRPASAQYLHDDFARRQAYHRHHYDHGQGYRLDPHHDYHTGHLSYYGQGPTGYLAAPLGQYGSAPAHLGSECPNEYRSSICSESNGCPFQRGRTAGGLAETYQRDGLGIGGHNHSHGHESHSGHSHHNHSHEDGRQLPGNSLIPSDRDYIAPPRLPPNSIIPSPLQREPGRQQPLRDDSTRMDSSPPSTFAPSSPAPSDAANPKRFDTPPPPTL